MGKTVAILGGTGKEGSGLGLRWALNGYQVIIGSRTAEKANTAAETTNEQLSENFVRGMKNEDAAANADLIVLTVPYSAQQATLESVRPYLDGKVLIDVTVPLAPPNVRTVNVPVGNAACLESQAFLGDKVPVVAAFQNVSSVKLKNPETDVGSDVLVCGDDDAAKEEAYALVRAAGMRPVDAGPLANAVAVEALTPVLLYINKRYAVKGAGIMITGIEES